MFLKLQHLLIFDDLHVCLFGLNARHAVHHTDHQQHPVKYYVFPRGRKKLAVVKLNLAKCAYIKKTIVTALLIICDTFFSKCVG